MKTLSLSLILSIFVAIAGLGLSINALYGVFNTEKPEAPSELSAYKTLGQNLLLQFDRNNDDSRLLATFIQLTGIQAELLSTDNFPIPDELRASFIQGEPLALAFNETAIQQTISLNFYRENTQQVLSFPSLSITTAEEKDTTLQLIMTLLFYAGILSIVLIWLAPLVRQLHGLRHTAAAFGNGDLTARISPHRGSYLADIEREFNHMADRIQQLIADNKLLSSAVSHDLKTPLARLRFGIDLLADSQEGPSRDKYQQRLEDDLSTMEHLIDTLLRYSKMDESHISLDFQPLELAAVTAKLLPESDEHCAIRFDNTLSSAQTQINADQRYLSMMINNIVGNAIKFSDSNVQVSIHENSDTLILSVEDDGQGIDSNERDNVLKPFFRGKHGETQAIKGHGMGLAIVARIARWHKADIQIDQSLTLGGAKVSIHFPKM